MSPAPGQAAGHAREGWVEPMLATAQESLPVEDGSWAYEVKWDGVRAVVSLAGDRMVIRSRSGNDITVAYPELVDPGLALTQRVGGRPVVLDGEIVALDASGRPSFATLQRRMHVSSPGQALALSQETPVALCLFDLLVDGDPVIDQPYQVRRDRLAGLETDQGSWQTPAAFGSGGADLLASTAAQGLEGVVAKRLASRYLPGRRSRDWVKVKNIRTQDVVVGGWRPGTGRLADTIGSLLVGVPGPYGLDYAGHVGTGFSDRDLRTLADRLLALRTTDPPFAEQLPRPDARDAHWVRPELVGEVRFTEWTPERRLRHPAWRGLRPDIAPSEVRRESTAE